MLVITHFFHVNMLISIFWHIFAVDLQRRFIFLTEIFFSFACDCRLLSWTSFVVVVVVVAVVAVVAIQSGDLYGAVFTSEVQHRHHRIEIEVEIYTHDLHVLYFGASCCWIGDGFSSDALFFLQFSEKELYWRGFQLRFGMLKGLVWVVLLLVPSRWRCW